MKKKNLFKTCLISGLSGAVLVFSSTIAPAANAYANEADASALKATLQSVNPANLPLDKGEHLIDTSRYSTTGKDGSPFYNEYSHFVWGRTCANGEKKYICCNNVFGSETVLGNGFSLYPYSAFRASEIFDEDHASMFQAKHKGDNKFTIDAYGLNPDWFRTFQRCTFHNWNVKDSGKKGLGSRIQTWSWNNKDEEKFYITYNDNNGMYRIWDCVNGLPLGTNENERDLTLKEPTNAADTYFQLFHWIKTNMPPALYPNEQWPEAE